MRYRDYVAHMDSPLGGITLGSDGDRLTGLWFDGQKHFGSTLSEEREEKNLLIFVETGRWLELYFAGKQPDLPRRLLRGEQTSGRGSGISC